MERKNVLTTTKREKFMYAIGNSGSTMMLMFISSYMTLYYTDSLGLTAAYAGSMMLVCRIFDGISDVIVGALIDKTHTRWGKARPWLVLSLLPMMIAYIATFIVPAGLSETGMKVYTFVTYFLVTVVFYTTSTLAYGVMLQRISFTSQDRSTITGMSSLLSTLFGTVLSMATPILIPLFGGEKNQGTWTKLVLIYGILSTFLLAITAFGVREKNIEAVGETEKNTMEPSKQSTLEELKSLLTNRYFYLLIVLVLCYFTSANLGGMSYYYARDVIGNTAYMSISGLISMLPMLIGIMFVPKLFGKFGKRRTMQAGLILSTVSSLAILLNPQSMVWNLVFMLIRAIGTLPVIVALGTLPGDISDYQQMKKGSRPEGLTASANSVGIKVGTGLGTALVGWMLAWGGYDSTAAVQSVSATTAMIATTAVVPAIMYIFCLLALAFWDLEKYQPQVEAFLQKHFEEKK